MRYDSIAVEEKRVGFVLSRSAWQLTSVPRPIATKAQLDVNVPGANIAVDGASVPSGSYTTNLLDDPEKTVQITVSAPGYETVTMNVTLRRGKTQQQKITLNLIPNTVATVIPKEPEPALVHQYFIKEAESVADGMNSATRSLAYSRIVLAQRTGGDTEGVRQSASKVSDLVSVTLGDLREFDRRSGARGGNEKGTTLATIAQAQAAIGDVSGAQSSTVAAKQEAPRVSNEGSRIRILNNIAVAQFLNGDMTGAQATLGEAKKLAMKGYGPGLASCLSGIACTQVTLGDVTGARKTILRAVAKIQKTRDYDATDRPMSNIAEAQAACGDIDETKATAEKIVNIHRKSEALGAISAAQAKNGDVAGTLATAAPIVEDNRKAEALVEIAKNQAQKGDLAGARDTAASIIVPFC